jgi:TRAP-type C4-dicarboxylate transport system substrate-binding protein
VDYVGAKLQPRLEQSLEDKGFATLFWVDAGFIHFFSKKPVNAPDDLRRLKFFAWAGSEDGLAVYRSAGFNVVPLETADIIPSLQTGLIEAAPAPPVYALAVQMDRVAPHMLELNWAPLVGACVVKKSVWEKIPEATRIELRKAAEEAGKKIKVSGRKENREAVQAMQQRGLTVHQPTPEALADWVTTCREAYPKLRGKIVPAEIFDEALRLIEEHRQQSGAR